MFSIAICDDTKKDSIKIKTLVEEYMESKSIPYQIRIFESGEEFLAFHEHFDLVFLDIALGGINGIQVGQKIREADRNMKVIYTTSYRQYCRQAVNYVHAFAYPEKPVTKEKMDRQLDEILEYIQEEHEKSEIVTFEILEITKQGKVETRIKNFEVNDIFYFEYFNRRIRMKLEREEYFFKDRMKDLAEKMEEYNFEVCHQCFLVNLKHVKRIKGYEVFMSNLDKLPVSQKKSVDFRKKLNKYIQSVI